MAGHTNKYSIPTRKPTETIGEFRSSYSRPIMSSAQKEPRYEYTNRRPESTTSALETRPSAFTKSYNRSFVSDFGTGYTSVDRKPGSYSGERNYPSSSSFIREHTKYVPKSEIMDRPKTSSGLDTKGGFRQMSASNFDESNTKA